MLTSRAVRLPESFRGGCSFGAGISCRSLPARLNRNKMGGKHGGSKAVNALRQLSTAVPSQKCGKYSTVILRSRALARRLEGWPRAPRLWPSFEARPEEGRAPQDDGGITVKPGNDAYLKPPSPW